MHAGQGLQIKRRPEMAENGARIRLGSPKLTEGERNEIAYTLFVDHLKKEGLRLQDPVYMNRKFGEAEKKTGIPRWKLVAFFTGIANEWIGELNGLGTKPIEEGPAPESSED